MLTQLEEQVMVERQKKLVQELQAAQQTLTADVKDKAITRDVAPCQDQYVVPGEIKAVKWARMQLATGDTKANQVGKETAGKTKYVYMGIARQTKRQLICTQRNCQTVPPFPTQSVCALGWLCAIVTLPTHINGLAWKCGLSG